MRAPESSDLPKFVGRSPSARTRCGRSCGRCEARACKCCRTQAAHPLSPWLNELLFEGLATRLQNAGKGTDQWWVPQRILRYL